MVRFSSRGYVEGASRGHILDRNAKDPGDPQTVDRRQDYDRSVSSEEDGGPGWEHWCTSRDIVQPESLGSGLLKAYLTLVAVLGGRFAATVTLLSRYVEALLPTPANERRDLLGEVLSAVLAPAQFLEMLCLCHLHRGKHDQFAPHRVYVPSRLRVAGGVCRRA